MYVRNRRAQFARARYGIERIQLSIGKKQNCYGADHRFGSQPVTPRCVQRWSRNTGAAQSGWFSYLHQRHKYTLAASLFQTSRSAQSGTTSVRRLQNKSNEFNMPPMRSTITWRRAKPVRTLDVPVLLKTRRGTMLLPNSLSFPVENVWNACIVKTASNVLLLFKYFRCSSELHFLVLGSKHGCLSTIMFFSFFSHNATK